MNTIKNEEDNYNLNIGDYTIGDLINIFDLEEPLNEENINETFIDLINQYTNNGKYGYIYFLNEARELLLNIADEIEYNNDEEQNNNHEEQDKNDNNNNNNNNNNNEINDDNNENINITKNTRINNINEKVKSKYLTDFLTDLPKIIPNRKDATRLEENKLILEQTRLPIQQEYNVPLVRGQINPILNNTLMTVVNVDSQFRPDINTPPNNFTYDLSDPLYKALKISLFNFEIQHCWYIIDDAYGTNNFYLDSSGSDNVIKLDNGNYSINEILNNLNTEINTIYSSNILDFSYNSNTNKVTITNNDSSNINIIFYDETGNISNFDNGKINYNLGWILGFREKRYTISPSSSITSEAMVDLYGPKYLLLCVDEFNNNNVNKSVINVTDDVKRLSLPSYFTPDISQNDPHFRLVNGVYVDSKLTEAQVHTINEILTSRQQDYADRYYGLSSSKVLARIPLEKNGDFEQIYINNGNLKLNSRKFFGPVDINRLHVTLYNDKGQLLNLNGQDFSFSLTVEQLYQY